jgi:RNA polymerase sigma-70 factor, ECF subfamily
MDQDQRLTIEQALAGDHEAFEMLIRTYSRTLFSIAFSILRNHTAAEDVVQEAFIKAFNGRKKIREPEKFPQWLFSIARNRAHDQYRKKQTLPLPEGAEEIEDSKIKSPHANLQGAELHASVHSVLSTLPEHHRTAITLRYLEGMDHRTIETTMGLSNGALRGILGRALETLRKGLKPEMLAEI